MIKTSTGRVGLALAAVLAMGAGDPGVPASRMDKPEWAAHFARKQEELRQNPEIILLGDSITRELDTGGSESWSNIRVVWQRWFACRHAVSLGFAGDTTANVLWRIENGELAGAAPKLAVVQIGTNNMRSELNWPAAGTADAIGQIVQVVHSRFPQTHIMVLGIPPNGHGARVSGLINAVNASLAGRDWAAENARFVPTADLFETNGVLDPSLYREPHNGRSPLHPDAQGWEKLAARIMAGSEVCPGAPPAP